MSMRHVLGVNRCFRGGINLSHQEVLKIFLVIEIISLKKQMVVHLIVLLLTAILDKPSNPVLPPQNAFPLRETS